MTIRGTKQRRALGLTHGWLSDAERAALPATAGWKRRRLIELIRVVEVGSFKSADSARFTSVVKIYKDLVHPRRFFPIVFRRSHYEIKRSSSARRFQAEVEVVDPAFSPDAFVRTSGEAVLKSVLKHMPALYAVA